MGETFYSILEVPPDADRETIRRAYREQVKTAHPDVSDNPAARERFKQLTTTRNVLLDPEKRRRYDRLGHEAYVREYVENPSWDIGGSDGGRSAGGRRADTGAYVGWTAGREGGRRCRAAEGGRYRNSRHGERHTSATKTDEGGAGHRSDGGTRPHTGNYAEANWQRASEAYRRADTRVGTPGTRNLRDFTSLVRRLAAWLVIHALLLASAIATSWFVFASTDPQGGTGVSAFVTAVTVVSVVLTISVFHLISLLYY